MVLIGLSWLIGWLLIAVFNVSVDKSLLVTAIIFILVGVLVGERPWEKK